jgi:hypothetical protein
MCWGKPSLLCSVLETWRVWYSCLSDADCSPEWQWSMAVTVVHDYSVIKVHKGYGSKSPHILGFATVWTRVASFILQATSDQCSYISSTEEEILLQTSYEMCNNSGTFLFNYFKNHKTYRKYVLGTKDIYFYSTVFLMFCSNKYLASYAWDVQIYV